MKKLTLKNYHKIYPDFSINCFSVGAPKCTTNLNPNFINFICNKICHTLFIWITEMGGGGKRKIEEL
jgi:hypothetical protein